MSEIWLDFTYLVFVQFLIFIIHAYYVKKLTHVPRILGWSMLIGIMIGIPFDIVLGKTFGLYSYALGFGMFFLLLNGALSYGLFAANTLLMKQVSLLHFCAWLITIVIAYEIINFFFSVWEWDFSLPLVPFVMILFIGYLVGAVFMIFAWRILCGHRFLCIENVVKKFAKQEYKEGNAC